MRKRKLEKLVSWLCILDILAGVILAVGRVVGTGVGVV